MADHNHSSATTPHTGGFWPGEYTYCPWCSNALEARQIGDSKRMACTQCSFIHFRNPGVGAAVVLFDAQGRLLLIKRGPNVTRPGRWAIPAGYVNYGEEIRQAAARELLEETGLTATIGSPIFVASNFHAPEKLTVGIWFQGTMTGGTLQAGDDAVAADWFMLHELPPMAFDTDLALIAELRER